MKVQAALVLGLVTCVCASAGPTYADATKFVSALERYVSLTGVWHKKSRVDRLSELKAAYALSEQTKRLFGDTPLGPFSECWKAAMTAPQYVEGLNAIVDDLEGTRQLQHGAALEAMRSAYTFGEQRQNCRTKVESLDAANRRQ